MEDQKARRDLCGLRLEAGDLSLFLIQMTKQYQIQRYSRERLKLEFMSLELARLLVAFFLYPTPSFLVELTLFILVCWLRSFELSRKFSKLSSSSEIIFLQDLKLPLSDSNEIDISSQKLIPQVLKESSVENMINSLFNLEPIQKTVFENRFSKILLYFRILILIMGLLFKIGKRPISPAATLLSTSLIPEIMFSLYVNAKLTLLIERLAKIKIDVYEKALDTDEFDEEAPPPSVSIPISLISILRRMASLIVGKSSQWLTWERPLVFRLSSCSLMAFLDRSGPISEPFPLPFEISHVSSNDLIRYPITAYIFDKKIDLTFEETIPHETASLVSFITSCYDPTNSHPSLPHLNSEWRYFVHSQTCMCIFGKALKGKPNVESISVKKTLKEDKCEFLEVECSCEDENKGETFRIIIVCGDNSQVSRLCKYYWDAGADATRELDQDLLSDLQAYNAFMLSQDAHQFFIGFVPLLENEVFNESAKDYPFIWVSSVSFASTPKEEMAELVRDLGGAGIRFVYFSPFGERMTKAYADRLELETDWNSCIILSESVNAKGIGTQNNMGYSAISDIKARLPRGVNSIRKHIVEVDDIPLHVSTFAECRSESSREMLKIYLENGEAVVTVSSLLNSQAHMMFSVSSLCIGMESGLKEIQSFASSLASLPYSFVIPYEASPYVFTDILKEARQLNRRMEHFLGFTSCYFAALSLSKPGIWEYLPIAVACLAFQRERIPVLKEMPYKHDLPFYTRKVIILKCLAFAPLFLCCLVCKYPFSIVLLLHHSIINYRALFVVPLACFINYLFEKKSFFPSWDAKTTISLSLCLGLCYYAINKLDQKYEKQQKRAKLIFNTKLGMHSPV